ncbi:HCO3 transporter family-domain-containing protein [Kockovaella imperatae]|uniref:HCO3 transporter family-domain-containing protein n=1 Tax=Kockovaella imperatae TaxID=4999 RepID=A0A1Y1UUM8_9TREE|nr:HCO3 transporter family-domain-containing protein [Kockovaella imperatae]ORX41176.1 HCO3 transporter family-domain-containing protein [Kockovaella imperatae]
MKPGFTMPASPRLSTRSLHSPPSSPGIPVHRALPRREPPTNPPDPPLTLLHPVVSASRYSEPPRLGEQFTSTPTLQDGRDSNTKSHAAVHAVGKLASKAADGDKWSWMPRIGAGMRNDIRKRAPWYVSDWTDAWNYRVVPSTLFIFFANVLPGIAFSLDLIETTGQYGVQEVLLASFIAAGAASFLGGQPLLISGVTGPITVFNKTIYDIFKGRNDGFVYLEFMGWVYLWGAIFHWVSALFNAVKGLKYVTRFACDTFGFYVAAVYVQYGIQVITRQFSQSSVTGGFLGIILAILTLILPHYANALARSGLIGRQFRRFCSDYGMPITIIAITGLAYWGRFDSYVLESNMRLPVNEANFRAEGGRDWVIKFWHLEGKYVGIALPFGLILFILFYFDANVSSLIAQGSEYPLKKPAAFHWDFFLLGCTTLIAGVFGVPAPNGLIPQAPLHTASLVILGYEKDPATSSESANSENEGDDRPQRSHSRDQETIQMSDMEEARGNLHRRQSSQAHPKPKRRMSMKDKLEKRKAMQEENASRREVPVAVVEQRVSNLSQGCLCLVLMTKPFEHVLGLIPKGVLAGLFWYMGTDALLSSGVTEKMLYLVREKRATSPREPLNRVRKSRICIFTIVELLGFGATFAITQTIAAIGFPIIIMLLVPLRLFVVPRLGFTEEELDILDGPVASPFTMESVAEY